MAITKTSASTATRDLHELVEMRILKQTGQKKATRYALFSGDVSVKLP